MKCLRGCVLSCLELKVWGIAALLAWGPWIVSVIPRVCCLPLSLLRRSRNRQRSQSVKYLRVINLTLSYDQNWTTWNFCRRQLPDVRYYRKLWYWWRLVNRDTGVHMATLDSQWPSPMPLYLTADLFPWLPLVNHLQSCQKRWVARPGKHFRPSVQSRFVPIKKRHPN